MNIPANTGDLLLANDQTDAGIIQTPLSTLNAIIQQIKIFCPIFNGNVTGAGYEQAFANAESVSLPLPAAYVFSVASQAEDQLGGAATYRQLIKKLWRVVVALDNSQNVRGQGAVQNIETIETQLWSAINGFLPNPPNPTGTNPNGSNPRGMYFDGYKILGGKDNPNRALFFVEFDFVEERWLNDLNAFKPVGAPLAQIETTYRFNNTQYNGMIP